MYNFLSIFTYYIQSKIMGILFFKFNCVGCCHLLLVNLHVYCRANSMDGWNEKLQT